LKERGGIEQRVRREKGIKRKRSYRVIKQRVRRKKGIERQRRYRAEGEKGQRD